MYNRYIPQPDGTYCRKRMPEPTPPPKPIIKPFPPSPSEPECIPEPPAEHPPKKPECTRCEATRRPENAKNFLQNLLPRDFDTGDLIIVLLLLLMSGDCPDDHSNAILTLLLYFYM